METPPLSASALRVADLSQSGPTTFDVVPTPSQVDTLRKDLDLIALRKVRLTGSVSPVGKRDWRLRATLGATVVQPCVATLAEVQTRLDTDVERLFSADFADFSESDTAEIEVEMPDDDTVEPLGTHIDPMGVLHEALALALPLYPRADASSPITLQVTEPGQTPMSDDDAKPFAALAGLRDKLESSDDES